MGQLSLTFHNDNTGVPGFDGAWHIHSPVKSGPCFCLATVCRQKSPSLGPELDGTALPDAKAGDQTPKKSILHSSSNMSLEFLANAGPQFEGLS